MITISVNSLITITSYFFQLFVHLSVLLLCLIQGVFFTGPALKVLSMELVPPNKEIDWFSHKNSKYGTGPAQEKKMTGSAQYIENG